MKIFNLIRCRNLCISEMYEKIPSKNDVISMIYANLPGFSYSHIARAISPEFARTLGFSARCRFTAVPIIGTYVSVCLSVIRIYIYVYMYMYLRCFSSVKSHTSFSYVEFLHV